MMILKYLLPLFLLSCASTRTYMSQENSNQRHRQFQQKLEQQYKSQSQNKYLSFLKRTLRQKQNELDSLQQSYQAESVVLDHRQVSATQHQGEMNDFLVDTKQREMSNIHYRIKLVKKEIILLKAQLSQTEESMQNK